MARIVLKAGHVQPVWAGHPWVYPQGIAKTHGKPEHGGEVEVIDAEGKALGRGLYALDSPVAVRLFTRNPKEHLDRSLLVRRFERARDLRVALGLPDAERTTGFRLLHGEGDGLPGLIVDRFGDCLVIQLGSAGMARRREAILDALEQVFAPAAILERTSARIAGAEKFEAGSGFVRGETRTSLDASELGIRYEIAMEVSQKTGFYFDQRPLRARIAALATGRSVLDLYSYLGAIGLNAARGGAGEVTCVDSSAPALALGRETARTNDLQVEFVHSKALPFLEKADRQWGLVIADPPKLAQSRAGARKAMQLFRRISADAVRATAPGGIVALSSCSAAIGIDAVERCLALGARDANREVVVFERVFQGADHPVPPAFPEGRYLSTVLAFAG